MLLAIILQFGARMLTFLPRFFVALQTLLAIQLSHLDRKRKEYKVEVYSSGYLALNQMKDCIMKRKVLRVATGLPVACNCVLSLLRNLCSILTLKLQSTPLTLSVTHLSVSEMQAILGLCAVLYDINISAPFENILAC